MFAAYLDKDNLSINCISIESVDASFLDAVLEETQKALGAVRWVVPGDQSIGGINHVYSDEYSKFIPNKPEGSWTFNEETWEWEVAP